MRGQRNVERIDVKLINDDFVVDFPLTEFQKIAIEIIYNMRTVKLSQLKDMTGYSYQYITSYMLKLHVNRFVERMFPLKTRDQKGTEEAYFMLDQAGAIFISGFYELPMKEVIWNRRDNLIKYDKLNHAFEISAARAAVERSARERGDKIINCVCDRHLFLKFKYEDNEFSVRPDMYFTYVENNRHFNYFVEIDLGTMAVTGNSFKTEAFDNKVAYYDAYKFSGEYRNKFNVFPRVLVITTTTDRAEKLLEAVRVKQKSGVEFLFTTLDLWADNTLNKIFIKAKDANGNDNKPMSMFD